MSAADGRRALGDRPDPLGPALARDCPDVAAESEVGRHGPGESGEKHVRIGSRHGLIRPAQQQKGLPPELAVRAAVSSHRPFDGDAPRLDGGGDAVGRDTQ